MNCKTEKFRIQSLVRSAGTFLFHDLQEILEARHRLIYDTTMACRGVFNISQAIGSDSLFALRLVARETDSKHGTEYSERVKKFHGKVAKEDSDPRSSTN